jgi:DNA integrity scanning protein DisA with diadenylate cyclase activity
MQTISRPVVHHAQHLARELGAQALVIYADAIRHDDELSRLLESVQVPTIIVTRAREPRVQPVGASHTWVKVPDATLTRLTQFKAALLVCLTRELLHHGDRIVFLGGADGSGFFDAVFVYQVGSLPEFLSLTDTANLAGDVAPDVFERVLTLATELAVEGREGRPVGTLFVVGDSDNVLTQSRSLVLNPFQGHPESRRNILDPAVEETIKEFSALDGAFIVRADGVVLSAGTQLVPAAPHLELPGGLGTRHAAAAGITASTEAVAVCVSQSTGTVSVFRSGRLVTTLPRPASGARLAGHGKSADWHPGPGGAAEVRRRNGGPALPTATSSPQAAAS